MFQTWNGLTSARSMPTSIPRNQCQAGQSPPFEAWPHHPWGLASGVARPWKDYAGPLDLDSHIAQCISTLMEA